MEIVFLENTTIPITTAADGIGQKIECEGYHDISSSKWCEFATENSDCHLAVRERPKRQCLTVTDVKRKNYK